MLPVFKRSKGETLTETVIALTILAVGITFAGTVMGLSLSNISISKNRVIAVGIAREGIEAVRNIRDTNWLRFSSRRRECWNHRPGVWPDECDGSAPIGIGDYIVYKDENQRFRLREYTVDPETGFDNGWLYLMDIDGARDTDGDGNSENDDDLYNHRLTADNAPLEGEGENPLGFERSRRSLFRRTVHIDYLTNEGDSVEGAGEEVESPHNRMVITVRVTWVQSGRELSVELRSHLTDYLGRENLDG